MRNVEGSIAFEEVVSDHNIPPFEDARAEVRMHRCWP